MNSLVPSLFGQSIYDLKFVGQANTIRPIVQPSQRSIIPTAASPQAIPSTIEHQARDNHYQTFAVSIIQTNFALRLGDTISPRDKIGFGKDLNKRGGSVPAQFGEENFLPIAERVVQDRPGVNLVVHRAV